MWRFLRWWWCGGPGLFPQQQGLGEVDRAGDVLSSNWCTPLQEVAGTAAVKMAVDDVGRREEEEVEEAWLVDEAELAHFLHEVVAVGDPHIRRAGQQRVHLRQCALADLHGLHELREGLVAGLLLPLLPLLAGAAELPKALAVAVAGPWGAS